MRIGSQKAASFNLDEVVAKMTEGSRSH